MKIPQLLLFFIFLSKFGIAQYYFQDIITERQVSQKWALYKENKVKSVNILSFESDNTPTPNFQCSQNVGNDYSYITTYTKYDLVRAAAINTYYNSYGHPIKTLDTSKSYQSTTEYQYDENNRLIMVSNSSLESINNINDVEQHFWKYGPDGQPSSMLKIKNGTDTTFVSFVKDENGNIVEEHSIKNKKEAPVFYYYYDDKNRLTDIVRYNEKVKKLLPDYIFTYYDNNQLSSMIFVPEGNANYSKWIYEYNAQGLRVRETCYSKRKELLGKIEYNYSFR